MTLHNEEASKANLPVEKKVEMEERESRFARRTLVAVMLTPLVVVGVALCIVLFKFVGSI